MGRTVQTFNTFLQAEEASWQTYRRGLRKNQRAAFDRLFTRVRKHTAEATCAARPVPFDAVVVSILLEFELEMERMQGELAALRESSK